MKELIAAINEQCFSCDDVGGVGLSGWVVDFDDVKDLINKALKGKVIVPVEPTTEMIVAGFKEGKKWNVNASGPDVTMIYKAMLSTIGEGDE